MVSQEAAPRSVTVGRAFALEVDPACRRCGGQIWADAHQVVTDLGTPSYEGEMYQALDERIIRERYLSRGGAYLTADFMVCGSCAAFHYARHSPLGRVFLRQADATVPPMEDGDTTHSTRPLTAREAWVLRRAYIDRAPLKAVAADARVTVERIKHIRDAALRKAVAVALKDAHEEALKPSSSF